EALSALWTAKWELAMPALVLVAMFSGLATAVEAAALTALYALVVQAFIHRDLSLRGDLLRAFTECVVVIGGVLIILGVAVVLTPLVGLNIFLASYRFKRPVLEVCAAALPMMAILGVGVLIITYIPWLTTGLLAFLGR